MTTPKAPQRTDGRPAGRPAPVEAQARAVELRAAGKGNAEIGRILGYDRKTIRRWLAAPAAAAEVAQIAADTRRDALSALSAAAAEIAEVLVAIALDPEEAASDRIAAAKTVLSRIGITEGAALQLQAETSDPLEVAARLLAEARGGPRDAGQG